MWKACCVNYGRFLKVLKFVSCPAVFYCFWYLIVSFASNTPVACEFLQSENSFYFSLTVFLPNRGHLGLIILSIFFYDSDFVWRKTVRQIMTVCQNGFYIMKLSISQTNLYHLKELSKGSKKLKTFFRLDTYYSINGNSKKFNPLSLPRIDQLF